MLKKCSISFLVLLGFLLWIDNDTTHARSTQPPIFNASAPGMSSCSNMGCHTGELNTGGGSLEIFASFDGNENVYTDGSLLDISLVIEDANAMRYGFQMVALDVNGISVGDFITNDAADLAIQESQGLEFINHLDIAETNSNTFSFQFQAPDEDVGPISFYATGLAADGMGSPADDFPYSKALDITWTEPSGIDTDLMGAIELSPNPSTDRLISLTGLPNEEMQIQVFDLQGKLHYSERNNGATLMDLNALQSGLYIVNIGNTSFKMSRKLVLR